MAVVFNAGFTMAHNEPVDNRLVLSKAEMLAMKKAKMPAVYITVCSDDGKLYLYNANNTVDETTGRFRLLESSTADTTVLAEEVATQLNTEEFATQVSENINTTVLAEAVSEDMESIPSDKINTLFQEEETQDG